MFEKHLETCNDLRDELSAVQVAINSDPAIPIPPCHIPDLLKILEAYSTWVSTNRLSLMTATKKADTSGNSAVARTLR